MELCVKKVWCSNCRKLVPCREESANEQVRVLCSNCRKALWQWNGLVWRPVKETASASSSAKKPGRRLGTAASR